MEVIGLKKLFTLTKIPKSITLEVDVVSKIDAKEFKVKDSSIKNNVVDLEVRSNKKQSLKHLEEGNRIRLLFVEFRKQEQKLYVLDNTKVFLLSKHKVSTL